MKLDPTPPLDSKPRRVAAHGSALYGLDLLCATDAAILAGVKSVTLTRWRRAGRLPGVLVGGRVCYERRSLLHALTSPTPDPELQDAIAAALKAVRTR